VRLPLHRKGNAKDVRLKHLNPQIQEFSIGTDGDDDDDDDDDG
jgi:hypothetical protein